MNLPFQHIGCTLAQKQERGSPHPSISFSTEYPLSQHLYWDHSNTLEKAALGPSHLLLPCLSGEICSKVQPADLNVSCVLSPSCEWELSGKEKIDLTPVKKTIWSSSLQAAIGMVSVLNKTGTRMTPFKTSEKRKMFLFKKQQPYVHSKWYILIIRQEKNKD